MSSFTTTVDLLDTRIVVQKDEKDQYNFIIWNGLENLSYRGSMSLPFIGTLNGSESFKKYMKICEESKTLVELALNIGDEYDPEQTHYVLWMPNPFTADRIGVILSHDVLSTKEQHKIRFNRLVKKNENLQDKIKSQENQIKDLKIEVDLCHRNIDMLEDRIKWQDKKIDEILKQIKQ